MIQYVCILDVACRHMQKAAVSCPFGHPSVHGPVDVAVRMQGTLRELPSNAEMIGTLKIVYEVHSKK